MRYFSSECESPKFPHYCVVVSEIFRLVRDDKIQKTAQWNMWLTLAFVNSLWIKRMIQKLESLKIWELVKISILLFSNYLSISDNFQVDSMCIYHFLMIFIHEKLMNSIIFRNKKIYQNSKFTLDFKTPSIYSLEFSFKITTLNLSLTAKHIKVGPICMLSYDLIQSAITFNKLNTVLTFLA